MLINTAPFSVAVALFALSASAAPKPQTVPGQIPGVERHDLCPRGWQYRVAGACSSGFIGCANPADSATCNNASGVRYDKTCGRPEYGKYYTCTNGFYGCSPDPNVCSQLGPNPPPQPIPGVQRPELCPPAFEWVAPGTCNSGFVGCRLPNDEEVCSGMRVFATCNRPEYGTYKTCPNGFFGCSPASWDPCKAPKLPTPNPPTPPPQPPAPKPPAPQPDPPKPPPSNNPKCAAGTTYYGPEACSSGFLGCGTDAVCSGPRRYYRGDCPAGTGFFDFCSNGFEGCTTIPAPCG